MRNILHPIASCLVLCVLLSDEAFSNEANDKRIVCFYQSYWSDTANPYRYYPSDIPADICTDIVYDSVGIDKETFELKESKDIKKRQMRQLTSLGSRFSSDVNFFLRTEQFYNRNDFKLYHAIMEDDSKRASFIASAVRLMREFGFNGLNLVPGKLEERDRRTFVGFLKDLFDAFKRYGYLLTCTIRLKDIVTEYDNKTVSGYDLYRISDWVDWINVDAVLRYFASPYVDALSPLYRKSFDVGEHEHLNVQDGLDILEKLGAPRRKLVLGIPFKGLRFELQSLNDNKVGGRVDYNFRGMHWSYNALCRRFSNPEWTRRFDHDGICAYIFNKDRTGTWKTWIGYEDEQSISIKMDFLNNMGYGGAYVDSLNDDDFKGLCGPKHSLLKTLHRTLFKKEDTDAVETAETVVKKRLEAMGVCPRCRTEL